MSHALFNSVMCKTCTNVSCAIFVQLAIRTVKIPFGGYLYSEKQFSEMGTC